MNAQNTGVTIDNVKNILLSWNSGQGAPYGGDSEKQLQDTTIANVLKCSLSVLIAYVAVQVWKDHTLLGFLSEGYVGKAHKQKSETETTDNKVWEESAEGYKKRAIRLAIADKVASLTTESLITGKFNGAPVESLLSPEQLAVIKEMEAKEKEERERFNFVVDKGLRDIKPVTKPFIDGRKKITVEGFSGTCEFSEYQGIVEALKTSKEYDQLGTGEVIPGTATLSVMFIEHIDINETK